MAIKRSLLWFGDRLELKITRANINYMYQLNENRPNHILPIFSDRDVYERGDLR